MLVVGRLVAKQGDAKGWEMVEYLDDGVEITCVAEVEEAGRCWDGWRRREAVSVRGRVYGWW